MAIVVLGLALGVTLILVHGRVPFANGDCLPPPAPPSGDGYRCYRMGHPHARLGVMVVLVSFVAFAGLSLVSYRRSRVRI
jgi:hypothetical protein